jgi:hypothetical protein
MTKLTLTASLLSNPIGLSIVIVSSGIIGGFVYHHMVCTVQGSGLLFHSGFWATIFVQVIIFFTPSESVRLHIHHYYWPLSLIQLCVFVSSDVSLITVAMLCAISMHGIAFFGIQPLIHHKESVVDCTPAGSPDTRSAPAAIPQKNNSQQQSCNGDANVSVLRRR